MISGKVSKEIESIRHLVNSLELGYIRGFDPFRARTPNEALASSTYIAASSNTDTEYMVVEKVHNNSFASSASLSLYYLNSRSLGIPFHSEDYQTE